MAAISSLVKRETKQEALKNENEDELMEVSDGHEEGEITDDEESELAPLAEAEALLENAADLTDSAKRFDLIGDTTLAVPKEELSELYATLGIDQDNERHYRFNTVHMRGTAKMTTKDIYEYFSGLEPSEVEWLDKGLCNVIWDDEILPARALLYLSVEIRNLEKKFKLEAGIIDSDDEGDEVVITGKSVDACELHFPIPPGRWRKGVAYDISKNIIMRYANKDDKKVLHSDRHHSRHSRHSKHKKSKHREIHVEDAPKNPWGSLAETWGHGEGVEKYFTPATTQSSVSDLRASLNHEKAARFADQFLERAVLERRFRPLTQPPDLASSDSEDSNSDSEDDTIRKRKLPQMYADREEAKQKIARMEAALKPKDLRARLNLRKAALVRSDVRAAPVAAFSEDSGEFNTEWATESYLEFKKTLRSEKTRQDSDQSEESEFDLSDDEPGEMLQIEIDNDRYKEKKKRGH